MFLFKLIKWNILWVGIGSFITALISIYYSNSLIFALKDLIFYSSFILLFLFHSHSEVNSNLLYSRVFFLGLFTIYIFLVTGFLFDFHSWQFFCLRQLFVPILIYTFSEVINLNKDLNLRIIRFIINFVCICVLIGIFFHLISIWDYIYLGSFFTAKGVAIYPNGLPAMFYEPLVPGYIRMVSTFLDPISFGHTIAGCLVCCFYSNSEVIKRRKLKLFLLSIGLILALSKGAILQVILCLTIFNYRISIPFVLRYIIVMVIISYVFLELLNFEGFVAHFEGVEGFVNSINMFGHGLGYVGNYAALFGSPTVIKSNLGIDDTFIGSLFGQLGILGGMIWLGAFHKVFKGYIGTSFMTVGSLIIGSQIIVSILSENTMNFTSFFIPCILGVFYDKLKIR